MTDAPMATEADVVRLYKDLLGRDPESLEAVRGQAKRPLLDVAISFAKTEEHTRHARRFAFEELNQLAKAIFGNAPPSEDWLKQFKQIIDAQKIGVSEVIGYFARISAQEAGAPWPEITDPFGVGGVAGAMTVMVPTFNSAAWIGDVASAYRQIGIDPLFAVDCRTTDDTAAALAASHARIVGVSSTEPRLESLMPAIAASAPTDWILRLDDDELPSGDLLRWIKGLDLGSPTSVYGFPRTPLRLDEGERLQRSRLIAFGPDPDSDRQWRLFRKDAVEFDARLHTPGFVVPWERAVRAPKSALILHFDWIVRTKDARLRKFRRYELQDESRARPLRHHVMWEDAPLAWHMFEPVRSELLSAFARRLKGKANDRG